MQQSVTIFLITISTLLLIDRCVSSSGDIVRNSTLWDNVLKRHVSQNYQISDVAFNAVDYEGVSKDSDFQQYIKELNTATLDNANITQNERYAFFINVYNALTVNTVIQHGCAKDVFGKCGTIRSIKDISNFPFSQVWRLKAGDVAGKEWTLDEIESYLRSSNNTKEDPRILFSIVPASISGPNLRREAYRGDILDFQLTDNMNNFLNNSVKGMLINHDEKKLILSPLFTWDKSDFVDYFKPNKTDATLVDFILLYLSPNHTDYKYLVDNKDGIPITYFNYDWDLNAQENSVPCSSKKRVCYTTFDLIITVGVVVLMFGTLFLARWVVSHKQQKQDYETLN